MHKVLARDVTWKEVDLRPSSDLFDTVAWDDTEDLQAEMTWQLGSRR